MYGPGLSRPVVLPSGSEGYAHILATKGLWSVDADRFPGGILLAEILAQCDPQFRQEFVLKNDNQLESYFERHELQKDMPRYQALSLILRNHWGEDISALFEQNWHSDTFSGCPTFSEWLAALSERDPVHSTGSYKGSRPFTAPPPHYSPAPTVSDPVQLNGLGQPVHNTSVPKPEVPSGGPVTNWRSLRPAPVIANAGTAGTSSNAISGNPATPILVAKSELGLKKPSFIVPHLNVILGFGLVAFVAVTVILFFSEQVQDLAISAYRQGFITFYTPGSVLLALLLGCVQAWVFKYRLRQDKRLSFILITAAGGLIAGLAMGIIAKAVTDNTSLISTNMVAGAIMGAIGGGVASYGQNRFLGGGAANKWVWFNLISWAVIWSIGWQLAILIHGAPGNAASAAFILILSGVSLAMFLQKTPELEF